MNHGTQPSHATQTLQHDENRYWDEIPSNKVRLPRTVSETTRDEVETGPGVEVTTSATSLGSSGSSGTCPLPMPFANFSSSPASSIPPTPELPFFFFPLRLLGPFRLLGKAVVSASRSLSSPSTASSADIAPFRGRGSSLGISVFAVPEI